MAKKVKKVVDAVVDLASSQKLHGAVDDLQKLGAAGDDALKRVPKNLNTDDTVKAMEDARANIIENEQIYSQGKGRKDVIDENPEKMLPAVVDNTDYAKQAHDKKVEAFREKKRQKQYDKRAEEYEKSFPTEGSYTYKRSNVVDANGNKQTPGQRAESILKDPDASPEKKAAAKRILDNQEIRKNSGKKTGRNTEMITEDNPNANRGAAAREQYETDRANRKGLTLEERVLRNEQGESHSLRTKEMQETKVKEMERKQAKAEKAFERAKQREAQRPIDEKFNEAQETIDKQNQGLVKRTLGNISDAGKKMVSNINDVRTGAARQRAADFASDYNEILRKNGSTDFIDIKGGRKLQGQYEGMSAQQIYDAQQQAAEEAAAKAEEFSKWWAGKKDGITEFAKENPMITAAGIAGTAIIGASLLDND